MLLRQQIPRAPQILAGILLVAAGLRIVLFSGITGADTFYYARTATNIAEGVFHFTGHVHETRLGLILPTALVYWVLGVNEYTSAAFPLLCSLASIALIFYFARLLFQEDLAGLVCAALLTFFPMEIFFASQLMSEIPLNFLLAWCVYLFLRGESLPNRSLARWYYLSAGVIWGWAYTTKIFAVFLVLFFLGYLLYQRKLSTAYLWITCGVIIVLLLEMGLYYRYTGNPFYAIVMNLLSSSNDAEPNPGNMYRNELFLYPYYWFISVYHVGFYYYFIFLATGYALWNKLKRTYIPLLWAGTLFLYLQFGREGKYLIHKEARFLSILTFPCLLVLGYAFTHYYRMSTKNTKRRAVLVGGSLLFLALTSLGFVGFNQAMARSEIAELRAVVRFLKQQPLTQNIYTDNLSAQYLNYFFGYQATDRITPFHIHNYRTGENTFPVDFARLRQALIIVNWHVIHVTQDIKGFKLIQYPEIIYHPPQTWTVLHTIPPPDSWIYPVVRFLRDFPLVNALPPKISTKMRTTIEQMLDNAMGDTIIYSL